MAAEFPELVVRNYADLVDALARVKNFLALSNETVEQISGLCAGHCDKLLGPTRSKKIGPNSLDLLLGAFALELVVGRIRSRRAKWRADGKSETRSKSDTASRAALWFADEAELDNGHNGPLCWNVTRTAARVAYPAQFGHDAVSFDDPFDCANLILAPHDGQSRTVGVAMRRLTLSTANGFVRA
jgi:hypothetical protein